MPPKKALSDGAVSERAQHFLKTLIERYIRDGQPIGSRTLAKDAGMDLSPATIRNVMSDLEDVGLIASPHTSAGRIPTLEGYRVFVDSLLTLQPVNESEVDKIRSQLQLEGNSAEMMQSVSQLLSGITRMAGVVTLPKREQTSFRQIEFLPLSGDQVLAILVTHQGEVHNRIIRVEREMSRSQLEQAANYLNHTFNGEEMERVRARLLQDMQDTRQHMDNLMHQAVKMAGQVVEDAEAKGDCVIAGQTNLMGFDELASMDRLRQLFEAFTEKNQIIHLLDGFMGADGVQIFLGGESGYKLFDGCSLVTAPYQVDDQVVGVLGVIGPTRMAYDRVVPLVDVTAKLLGAALKSS